MWDRSSCCGHLCEIQSAATINHSLCNGQVPAQVIPTMTTRQVLSTHFTGLVRLSGSSKGIRPMNERPRTRRSDSEVPFLIHSLGVSDYGGLRTGKVEVRTHTLDDEGRTGEGTGFCCGIEVRPVLEPCRDAQDRAKCLDRKCPESQNGSYQLGRGCGGGGRGSR